FRVSVRRPNALLPSGNRRLLTRNSAPPLTARESCHDHVTDDPTRHRPNPTGPPAGPQDALVVGRGVRGSGRAVWLRGGPAAGGRAGRRGTPGRAGHPRPVGQGTEVTAARLRPDRVRQGLPDPHLLRTAQLGPVDGPDARGSRRGSDRGPAPAAPRHRTGPHPRVLHRARRSPVQPGLTPPDREGPGQGPHQPGSLTFGQWKFEIRSTKSETNSTSK